MRQRAALCALMMLAACSKGAESAQSTDSAPRPDPAESADESQPDLEHAAFPLLLWSAWAAEQDYFDPRRFSPLEQVVWATRFIGLQTPEFFAEVDPEANRLDVTVRSAQRSFDLSELSSVTAAAHRLQDVLSFTQSVLDLDEEDRHQLEYVAINGFFSVLDPHTVLLTPEEHAELGVRTRGEFAGIGAEIRPDARRIRIVRVIEGGPAEKAGLQAGDLILRINDEATVNMTGREAQQILRGQVGSTVRLVVRRPTGVLTVPVERGVIRIPSVESAMLPDGVGYVRLSTFQETTGGHLSDKLERLASGEGMIGLVLDLRGNSGGLLTQAVAVLDQFVDDGELVIVHSARGREAEIAKPVMAIDRKIPVVALMDEHAASAAEIVAGGLQALGRGIVVGRDSFGKGTVQMLKPASPYGRELALKLTVAEYRVAGDRRIQSVGVRPDLVLLPVELSDLPGVARFFDRQRFEQARERARTAHLPSARNEPKVVQDSEAPQVHFAWQAPSQGVEASPPELRDPEVRLARQVALGLATKGTGSWGDRLPTVAEQLRASEDRNIARVLHDRFGIDWTDGDGQARVHDLHIEASVGAAGSIEAGKPFPLLLTIENRGPVAARRVHIATRCAHEELDGIELLVGSIAAGKSVQRTLQLQVLPWRTSFVDVLDIDLHVGDSDPVTTAAVDFEIESREHPAFRLDHWIVDDPELVARAPKRPDREPIAGEPEFEVRGNGDGILQRGERVLVAFVVQNDGPGRGEETYVVLRNLSGKQGLLEEGTLVIGQLPPKKIRSGAFGLTINEDADPRVPMELELVVGDAHAHESVRDQLRLRILERPHRIEPQRELAVVGPDGARVYNGAHASAAILGQLSPGAGIRTHGEIDGWTVVDSPQGGRHLYIPADLLRDSAGGSARPSPDPLALRFAVVPPIIDVAEPKRRTTASEIQLEGVVRHPEKVRDVMLSVLAPGPAQIERKIHYGANPHRTGEAAKSFPFSVTVPLEPGSNRITVIARDDGKIEREVDVWVYRDSPSAVAATHGEDGMEAPPKHRGSGTAPPRDGAVAEPSSLGRGRP